MSNPDPTPPRLYGRPARLAAMGYDTYAQYTRSPEWATTKARYRASKLPQKCRICGERWVDLHHRSYKRTGAENLHDLIPLCRKHHEALHVILRPRHRQEWWQLTRQYIKRERRRRRKRGLPVPR